MKIVPKLAVIIPAYNCHKYLSSAVDSCLNQLEPGDQVVVVNDGSPEPLDDIEEKYKNNNQVLWINQENQGVSAARNTGVLYCDADFVKFLDADDEMYPKTLNYFRYFATSDDNVDIIFSDYYVEPINNIRFKYSDIKNIEEFLVHKVESGHKEEFVLLSDTFGIEYNAGKISPTCICTDAVMIRKNLFQNLGGFDKSIKIKEDIECWKRIVLSGNVGYIKNVPSAIYFKWRGDIHKYIREYERTRDVHTNEIRKFSLNSKYWNSRKVLSKNELCMLFWNHPYNLTTSEILSTVFRSILYFPQPIQQSKYFLSAFVPKILWHVVLHARYRYF